MTHIGAIRRQPCLPNLNLSKLNGFMDHPDYRVGGHPGRGHLVDRLAAYTDAKVRRISATKVRRRENEAA